MKRFCSSLICLQVVFVAGVFSVTIQPPALQRKVPGESCKLQWSVTGTFMNYSINYLKNGNPTPLGYNSNHSADHSTGVIRLLLWDVQTMDAGSYQLTLHTGSAPDLNSVGILFVYLTTYSSIILASGPNPAREGDTIALNCTVTSYSQPVEYRPKKLYYFWSGEGYELQNISSGPAITTKGVVMDRYMFQNDGKTLVITSVHPMDTMLFCCQVQEDGSPYKSIYTCPEAFQMNYPPFIYAIFPPSKTLSLNDFYTGIAPYFYCMSNPPLTSYTNWTFTSASGDIREFPAVMLGSFVGLNITLHSTHLYGNCTITLNNTIGSTTETFQVIPTAPPDAPSQLRVWYVTHNIISFQWSCMSGYGYIQTVFLRLVEVTTNTELDIQITTIMDYYCYNSSFTNVFQQNLQPDTQYMATIWSTTRLGSSDVKTLMTRTQNRTSLNVSCEDISITGSQAIINVSTSFPTLVLLNVTCCLELTAECVTQSYTLSTKMNQIVFENLSLEDEYVFDFTLFNGDFYNYLYVLTVLKGVRISKTSNCESTCVCPDYKPGSSDNKTNCSDYKPDSSDNKPNSTDYKPNSSDYKPDNNTSKNPFVVATIVLAILLGVAISALIGIGVGFLNLRRRQKMFQNKDPQLPELTFVSSSGQSETYDMPIGYTNGSTYASITPYQSAGGFNNSALNEELVNDYL